VVLCEYLDSECASGLGVNGRCGLAGGEENEKRWGWERGWKKGDGGEGPGAGRERDLKESNRSWVGRG
jgi:hypothetical protein